VLPDKNCIKSSRVKKKLMPGRYIVLGFLTVIFLGTLLLLLPFSRRTGVSLSPVDAFFTSTSAVCVTGLVTVDTADTYSIFGRFVIGTLIQIGGLGVTSVSVGLVMISGRKIGMRERTLAREAMNYGSMKGVLSMVKAVLITTLCFELLGLLLCLIVFTRDYPFWKALGISAFHSVSSFNNAGFDILGSFQSLGNYKSSQLLNLITGGLIIFGGLGFYVTRELLLKRSFRHLSLHSKMVLSMSFFLIVAGCLLLRVTNEHITWLGALFSSITARTAGFSTFSISGFSNAGLCVLLLLMFIGASPGSTGGGIKTTTFLVLVRALYASSTNKPAQIFRRRMPSELLYKSFIIALLAALVIIVSTFLLCAAEPAMEFRDLLFEAVSAFATVGLSIGVTPALCTFSKFVLILTMFIGRIGPVTVASIWIYRQASEVSYAEESFAVG
jgi:trk system potassium uptake protein TrkH